MKRLFLGVPLEESVRNQLHKKLHKIPGKKVPEQNWHFTLHFFGNIPEIEIPKLNELLKTVALPNSFEVTISELGAFPNTEVSKIVWMGITSGAAAFTDLALRFLTTLEEAGYPIDKRPFVPHITLSRLSRPQNLDPWIKNNAMPKTQAKIDKVVLYESIIRNEKVEYVELFFYNLD